jgi:hypothetical protein
MYVRSSAVTTAVLAMLGSAAFAPFAVADGPRIESPIQVVETRMGVTSLVADAAGRATLRGTGTATLANFPVRAGMLADVEVRELTPFNGSTRWVMVGQGGEERELSAPDVTLLGGQIAGDETSTVFIAWSPEFLYGYIEDAAGTRIISSGGIGEGNPPVMFDLSNPPAGVRIEVPPCLGALVAAGGAERGGDFGGRGDCRAVAVAIETDEELLTRFRGNPSGANAYIATLTAAATQVYQRDVSARIQLSYVRLWTPGTDPWTVGDAGAQLDQFRTYWLTNMGSVRRDLAHFLSVRNLGGGVAWLSATCGDFGFAVSGNLAGQFPYPIVDNSSQNWDPMVYMHELGHNLGTLHTHDGYTPPVDGCGNGDCSLASQGTIMSYCHLCAPGIANVALRFGPRVSDVIRAYMGGTPCDLSAPVVITQQPADRTLDAGSTLTLNAAAGGAGVAGFQWHRNGVPIVGATSSTLRIRAMTAALAGSYTVVASNGCTSATSNPATVVVEPCPADFNADGFIDFFDFDDYIRCFSGLGCPAGASPDFNGDSFVDFFDLDEFVDTFEDGCGISACAPETLTATLTAPTTVRLAWTVSPACDPARFEVEGRVNGGEWTLLAQPPSAAREIDLSGLEAVSAYDFRVRACANASACSDWSDPVSATTGCFIPAVPAGGAVTLAESRAIEIAWTHDGVNTTGFKIDRRDGGGLTFREIATVGGAARSFRNEGLTPGVLYTYRVRAFQGASGNQCTSENSATFAGTTPCTTVAVGDLRATSVQRTTVDVAWSDLAGNELTYKLQRRSGQIWVTAGTIPANSTSGRFTGLTANTTYLMRILTDGPDCDAPSVEITVTTLP